MTQEEIIKLIKNNIRLEVGTTSVYRGHYEGSLYEDVHRISLMFGDETLSEITLD